MISCPRNKDTHNLKLKALPPVQPEENVDDLMITIQQLTSPQRPHDQSICPWNFGEPFQDKDFPSLSGAKIISIATHPNAMKLGYGSTTIELLARFLTLLK